MNLHEYQSKSILKTFGVKIQEGLVATSADEAVEAAKKLQEDFIKLEIQNSKLMRDLGSAENKIKELKNKATKSKK